MPTMVSLGRRLLAKVPLVARRLLVLLGFGVLGVAVYAWLHYTSEPPRKRPARERGQAVRVMEVAPMEAVPRVTGYGVVKAQREWQAVASVGGTIVEMDDAVEVGRIVQEGKRLFRIDPATYELARNRTESTVQQVRAQIEELRARESSARASLAVEMKVLALARQELERMRKLHETDVASKADVEAAERGVLAVEKAVQGLNNTLLELPASRKVLEAQLAQQRTGVEGARIELAKTEVVAPFTMRLRQVSASLHQTVGAGHVVLVGDGIDAVEVLANMPLGTIGPLLGQRDPAPSAEGAGPAPAPESNAPGPESSETGAEPSETGPEPGAAPAEAARPRRSRASAIQATIRLEGQAVEATWKGTFRRFQGVDPVTRTMIVVVEVTEPRRREGRSGPPLSPGLHVEVELRGVPRPGCLAIPRSALHRDKVHVVDADNRLAVREVEVDFVGEEFACLSGGLTPGERVILTQLAPAVSGMLLSPREDRTAAKRLAALVGGETAAP